MSVSFSNSTFYFLKHSLLEGLIISFILVLVLSSCSGHNSETDILLNLANGNLEQAKSLAEKSAKKKPQDATTHFALNLVYYFRNHYDSFNKLLKE